MTHPSTADVAPHKTASRTAPQESPAPASRPAAAGDSVTKSPAPPLLQPPPQNAESIVRGQLVEYLATFDRSSEPFPMDDSHVLAALTARLPPYTMAPEEVATFPWYLTCETRYCELRNRILASWFARPTQWLTREEVPLRPCARPALPSPLGRVCSPCTGFPCPSRAAAVAPPPAAPRPAASCPGDCSGAAKRRAHGSRRVRVPGSRIPHQLWRAANAATTVGDRARQRRRGGRRPVGLRAGGGRGHRGPGGTSRTPSSRRQGGGFRSPRPSWRPRPHGQPSKPAVRKCGCACATHGATALN